MTADELLCTIIEKRIQVTPVVSKVGIERWNAQYREYYPGNGSNYTKTDQFARGSTLEEAVVKLLAGKTIFRLSDCGTGYVECFENY